jgi:hypothetical protein
VRADFPHTASQWLRGLRLYATLRILNRPAQAMEPESLKEGTAPSFGLTGSKLRAGALDPKAGEPLDRKAIDLDKLDGRIPRSVIRTPPPKHGIDVRNHGPQILVTPMARREFPKASADPCHRAPRRPTLQKVDASPRPDPQRAAQALAQMTSQEVESLM